jgi:hypothetical protein
MDFSFKFNEIKCCTLHMNWLIQEKIFTYFYNKFRPVNCTHYIKCGINSSLLTSFWLLQVCGTLDHCFIMTHSIHNLGDLQIHFSVIFLKQSATHIPTLPLTHLYTLPCLWPREQPRWQRSWVHDFAGQCLLWRLSSRKTFFEPSAPDSEWVASASNLIFYAAITQTPTMVCLI